MQITTEMIGGTCGQILLVVNAEASVYTAQPLWPNLPITHITITASSQLSNVENDVKAGVWRIIKPSENAISYSTRHDS